LGYKSFELSLLSISHSVMNGPLLQKGEKRKAEEKEKERTK
jgi:hypothetical protein